MNKAIVEEDVYIPTPTKTISDETDNKMKDVNILSMKEKSLLHKRNIDEFTYKFTKMSISEIRSKLKSPTHFRFMLGSERMLIS